MLFSLQQPRPYGRVLEVEIKSTHMIGCVYIEREMALA